MGELNKFYVDYHPLKRVKMKINSEWIVDINIRTKAVKTEEEA